MEENNDTTSKRIALKSSDGELIVVPEAAAMQSNIIRHMIEDINAEDNTDLLLNVTAPILAKAMDYCTEHAATEKSQEELRDWDEKFIDVDMNMLHDLLVAASYLEIDGLLDLAAEKCAGIIRGKSVEEIRQTFNLTVGFDAEEEQEIRDDHPFAFVP